MNKILLISTFLLTITFVKAQDDRTLNIVSYNILHGATMNQDFNLDNISNVIRKYSPHLVALQEVDYKTNRARKLDLTTELGLRLKMAGLFGEAMPYDGGSYGEGVLSHFPILSSRAYPLPYSPGNEPRAALMVNVRMASGDTITFVGTHLDHLRDPKDRKMQTEVLNELLLGNMYPVILAGDLNAPPDSEEMKTLTDVWKLSDDEEKPTFSSADPQKKIDYILLYPRESWEVLDSGTDCDKVGSDHCLIYSKVRLKE